MEGQASAAMGRVLRVHFCRSIHSPSVGLPVGAPGSLFFQKEDAHPSDHCVSGSKGSSIHPSFYRCCCKVWNRFADPFICLSTPFPRRIDRKWGQAYLTREFFHMLGDSMPERVLLAVAEEDASGGNIVAGALNLIGSKTLFGRNWGCAPGRQFKMLHFELCYYQVQAGGLGFVCLLVCPFACVYLFIHPLNLSIHPLVQPSGHAFDLLSMNGTVFVSVRPSFCLSIYLSVCPSVCLSSVRSSYICGPCVSCRRSRPQLSGGCREWRRVRRASTRSSAATCPT
jgi:Peptidogalycan biosysnthesis/recognition